VRVSLAADLAAWRDATAAVLAHAPSGLDAAEAAALHRELRATCDRVLAYAGRLLAAVEADGRWATGGTRTFPEWVARQRGSSVGAARSEVALGRALEADLPVAAAAVEAGEITLEHAQVLARLGPTSEARRAALASDLPDRNEAALVEQAKRMDADRFRRVVKRWAGSVDAAQHEREHADAVARERLVLSRRDGGVAFEGFLTVEHADVLQTALRAVVGVPAATDRRTTEQRMAGALHDLARLVLDRGLAGAGGTTVRPHISVHVGWETFCRLTERAGAGEGAGGMVPPAELDDGEPIPASVLARIACDSEVTRIVFGPDSRPLDVGRAQRTFTGPQRRAVVARDRHCQYPDCQAPPQLGEVHHVRWWVRDRGPTAVANGVLLCWYHHDLVHRRDLEVVPVPDGWEVRDRGGPVARARGPAPPLLLAG